MCHCSEKNTKLNFWLGSSGSATRARQGLSYLTVKGEGIKPGTNAWNSGPKFCQPNMSTKHACIKLKFMSNVDYRLFLEMHITTCFNFFIFLKFNRNTRPCQAFPTRDQFPQYSRCQAFFNFYPDKCYQCQVFNHLSSGKTS